MFNDNQLLFIKNVDFEAFGKSPKVSLKVVKGCNGTSFLQPELDASLRLKDRPRIIPGVQKVSVHRVK